MIEKIKQAIEERGIDWDSRTSRNVALKTAYYYLCDIVDCVKIDPCKQINQNHATGWHHRKKAHSIMFNDRAKTPHELEIKKIVFEVGSELGIISESFSNNSKAVQWLKKKGINPYIQISANEKKIPLVELLNDYEKHI